jgi:hypothetical protein
VRFPIEPSVQKELMSPFAAGQKSLFKAPIVDSFVENKPDNIGLSLAGFTVFASKDQGVVRNVSWAIVDN